MRGFSSVLPSVDTRYLPLIRPLGAVLERTSQRRSTGYALHQLTRFHAIPWLAAAIAVLLALVFPEGLERNGQWAFLASALVLGLPHGALDVLWPTKEWSTLRTSGNYVRFILSYVVLMAVMGLIWFWHTPAAFLLFLGLTAMHWGCGDFWPWPQRLGVTMALALGKGLLVVGAPLAFHAAQVRTFTLMFSTGSLAEQDWRTTGIVLVCAAVVAQLVGSGYAKDQPRLLALFEWCGLLVLAWILPAFAFIALYFAWFHSFRHLLRVEALHERIKAVKLLGVGMVVTILLIAMFLTWMFSATEINLSLPNSLTAYFIALSILTLPHALLVAAWDRRSWLRNDRSTA